MIAAYIEEPGKIVLKEEPVPEITQPTDVILRVKYTGICGSDVHMYLGENAFIVYPRVFGHEFVGEVVAVGSNVTSVQIGDHAVGEPIQYCGSCYPCKIGHPNVCENLQVYGVHLNGGCQSYIKMPAKCVHPVSKHVPMQYAVLAEPLTIGFRSCNRAQLLPNDIVLIQGSGTIGLCAMLAAKEKGATVIMTDLYDHKLDYARQLGADYGINTKKEDLFQAVMTITHNKGANVILDCVGNKQSLSNAIDLASAAGRIVELGMAPIESGISHLKICRRDLTIMGTRLQAHEFPEAIRFLESNWEKLQDFITAVYPVSEVFTAFKRAIQEPGEIRKILIEL